MCFRLTRDRAVFDTNINLTWYVRLSLAFVTRFGLSRRNSPIRGKSKLGLSTPSSYGMG